MEHYVNIVIKFGSIIDPIQDPECITLTHSNLAHRTQK